MVEELDHNNNDDDGSWVYRNKNDLKNCKDKDC